ncbi:CU044_2847 family protein [Salipiger sp. H15]|uniref:CU044_2847 family protein n=1 Tax=Alloyangia sp. H15 TaxID=3029062 RepID=A0AAU8ANL2_9RHOB
MTEKKILKLTLGEGQDEAAIFMEVEADPTEPQEESSGMRKTSAKGEAEIEAKFAKITKSLAGIANSMHEQMQSIASDARPDKLTLELSGTLKGKANFWIVEGESSGALKFTLTWESKD